MREVVIMHAVAMSIVLADRINAHAVVATGIIFCFFVIDRAYSSLLTKELRLV